MKTLKKTTLASLVGAAALTVAGAANATIVVGGSDGYEFSVDGNINQFYVYTDDNRNNIGPDNESSEIRDGLLPAFFGFNVSAPETNGLKVGARVSISPSTNGTSQDNSRMEQREAFATIEGSFGQVLMGKALGLYGSHNILTEQTLYGVGWGTGGNGTTTLGGIGFGYDYADWRSQIKWTSPDMHGFKVAIALVDPANAGVITDAGATGPLSILSKAGATGYPDEDSLRYEADLSYAHVFDGGDFMLWASGAWQEHDHTTYRETLPSGAQLNPEDAKYWTLGGTVSYDGFQFMAQYSDGEDTVKDTTGRYAAHTTASGFINADWDQFIVQAGYRFAGTTLLSANYSELSTDVHGVVDQQKDADRITVGIYHDVTSNLKLVAEYSNLEHDDSQRLDQDIFSIGGFVTW